MESENADDPIRYSMSAADQATHPAPLCEAQSVSQCCYRALKPSYPLPVVNLILSLSTIID